MNDDGPDDSMNNVNNNNNDDDDDSNNVDNDNLFVPLNAVETLQRAASVYLQSGTVRLFVKLALFFVIPATAVLLTVVYALMHHHPGDNDNPDTFLSNFWRYVTILTSQSLLQTTLGAVSEGAIAVAVAELYVRRRRRNNNSSIRWFVCLQKACTKLTTLLLAGLVAGICIVLGYSCFYIPGLILKVNFLVVTPVIVLEDELSSLSALGRSWDLVKGRRWYVLKCYLGMESLYWLTNWIIRAILKEDENTHPFFSLTFHLLKTIPSTMITPFFGILKTVIYINLMVIQEGITKEQFAQQVDQGFAAAGDPSSRVPLLVSYDTHDNHHHHVTLGDIEEVTFEDAAEQQQQQQHHHQQHDTIPIASSSDSMNDTFVTAEPMLPEE